MPFIDGIINQDQELNRAAFSRLNFDKQVNSSIKVQYLKTCSKKYRILGK